MQEIRILRTDSISLLEIGSEQIEIKDYIIKSSADGSTELEVKICGVSDVFELSANLREMAASIQEQPEIKEANIDRTNNPIITGIRSDKWRRFEVITHDPEELKRAEQILDARKITRQELAAILFSLRVRPGFVREDFGIVRQHSQEDL